MNVNQSCKEKGECFAKQYGRCRILTTTFDYGGGTCPFQKPVRDVTDGRHYPWNPNYSGR